MIKMMNRKEITDEIVSLIWESSELNIDLDRFARKRIMEKCSVISDLKANDLWVSIRLNVIKALQRKINECNLKQITPNYIFYDKDQNKLIKYSITIKDSKSRIKNQLVLQNRNILLESIRELNWRSFEYLCEQLLIFYGCYSTFLGPGTKEGGLDLLGKSELKFQNILPNLSCLIPEISFIFYVQVKQQTEKISETDLILFVKQFEKFLTGLHKMLPNIPPMFKEPDSLKFPIFLTSSDFTSGAIAEAKKNNVIIKSGEKISEDLLSLFFAEDITRWFISNGLQETTIDKVKILSWISGLTKKS